MHISANFMHESYFHARFMHALTFMHVSCMEAACMHETCMKVYFTHGIRMKLYPITMLLLSSVHHNALPRDKQYSMSTIR